MKFKFRDLDDSTREYMGNEIEMAMLEGNIFFSKRFTETGKRLWPTLLLQAATNHDEHWLTFELERNSCIKGIEATGTPFGEYTKDFVPHTTTETIAEREFNRYYMLGLCLRAFNDEIEELIVYRAKQGSSPGSSSRRLIGQKLDPDEVFDLLRPVCSSLQSELTKPNSGISLFIPTKD